MKVSWNVWNCREGEFTFVAEYMAWLSNNSNLIPSIHLYTLNRDSWQTSGKLGICTLSDCMEKNYGHFWNNIYIEEPKKIVLIFRNLRKYLSQCIFFSLFRFLFLLYTVNLLMAKTRNNLKGGIKHNFEFWQKIIEFKFKILRGKNSEVKYNKFFQWPLTL